MAVEARHLCLFPPQILGNREVVNGIEANGNMYGASLPMGYGVGQGPLSGMTTMTDTLIPPPTMYGTTMADSIPVKEPITYSVPVPSRKRPRDAAGITFHPLLSFPANAQNQQHNINSNRYGSFTFLGEDIVSQIQQQQLEIDGFIARHTAKLRMEIEERRKNYSLRIITVVEENIMKKLRAKEEKIDQIGKLNWALEERVKSLCIENQIWRELAQSNEATANALRVNLEQVLAQVQVEDDQQQRHQNGGGKASGLMDDAQSCCGSNFVNEAEERRASAENTLVNDDENIDIDGRAGVVGGGTMNKCSRSSRRLCRNCGKDEASVLLLPCRHLCLCSVCGPSLHTCPICNWTKNATLDVNL